MQKVKESGLNETWFFNGGLFIKEQPNAEKVVISHITDLSNRFDKVTIDGYLRR